MRKNGKYLVAVALLAVLAVAFGVFGTVAPPLAKETMLEPQQESSESVGHFQNPPSYDSGWVDMRDKRGQSLSLTHNLNTTEALVDVVGTRDSTDVVSAHDRLSEHKLFFGVTLHDAGWNQTYGGMAYEEARSIVQTRDGGYAIAGWTNSFGSGDYDVWLVKTDSSGNMEWNQTYGGAGEDRAFCVVQTSDRGYTVAGWTLSFGAGNFDFWLVNTDSMGNTKWNRTYGGTNSDFAYCVIQTSDRGYAITGATRSSGAGWYDFWLIKTDSYGNMQWNRTYGSASEDRAYSVVQTSDGGYAITGFAYAPGGGYPDFWLVKADPYGNMQWNQTYGGDYDDRAYSVIQTVDGEYAVAGATKSFGANPRDTWDFWLVKTDSSGNMQWNQTYGGFYDDAAWSVAQTSDKGYAIAGWAIPYAGAGWNDFWLVRTDSAGYMLRNQTYGGTDPDVAYSMVPTSDGGYALAGATWSDGAGLTDFWLVKTEGEVGLSIGLSMTDFTNSTISLYRGSTDPYWNYVRVRIWLIEEPSWIYGDINMDGIVDAKDLYILSRNYGKTISILSVSGIIAVAGIHAVKKRKQPKQPSQIR